MTDSRSDAPPAQEMLVAICGDAARLPSEHFSDMQRSAFAYLASHLPEMLRAHAENRALRDALTEIAKGEGRYSNDPLKWASNTVTDMKRLATDALTASSPAPSSVQGKANELVRLKKELEDSQADIRAAAREGDAR